MFGNQNQGFGNQAQLGLRPPTQGGLFGNTPQNSTPVFGQPATPTFGNAQPQTGGPFGAPQNPAPSFGNPSLFGQPQQQQQQQTGFPQLGQPNQPQAQTAFGNPAQPQGGLFGQQSNQPKSLFGAPTQPGQPAPSPFAPQQTQPQTNPPFGSFGQSSGITPSPFGPSQTNPLTPSFGTAQQNQKPAFPTPFDQPQQQQQPQQIGQGNLFQSTLTTGQTTSPFGMGSTQPQGPSPFGSTPFGTGQPQNPLNQATIFSTPGFGQQENKPFGSNIPFGGPTLNAQQQQPTPFGNQPGFPGGPQLTFSNQKGSIGKPFQVLNNPKNNKVNTITYMPEYSKKSLALLRLEDYIQYKTNPASVTNQVARSNLDMYFQKLGQTTTIGSMNQPFNPGLASPVKQPGMQGLNLGGTTLFKPPTTTTSLFPDQSTPAFPSLMGPQQGNKPGMTGAIFGQPQQQPQPTFPSFNPTGQQNAPTQPQPPGLFNNPPQPTSSLFPGTTQTQPSGLFPSNPSQPSNLFNPQQPSAIGGGSLFGPTASQPSGNKPTSLFSQPTSGPGIFNQPSSSPGLFPQQGGPGLFPQPTQQGGPSTGGTGLDLFKTQPSQPGLSLFPQKDNLFAQPSTQPQGLFDQSKQAQPLGNYAPQTGATSIFPNQQAPSVPSQQVNFPLPAMFGDVQKGPFAIYCFPLDNKAIIPKMFSQMNEGLNANQMMTNLDDELRSMRVGSERRDFEGPFVPPRRYEGPAFDLMDQDYYSTKNFDTYERYKDAKNVARNRLSFNRRAQNPFLRESKLAKNSPKEVPKEEKGFNLTIELLVPGKQLTLNSRKFKPSSMITEVLKFLVEDKQLLDNSDIQKVKLLVNGKKVSILSKLQEVGIADNDILTVSLEDEKEIEEADIKETKTHLPTLTKKGYECKPTLREMGRMSEMELANLPSFEIWNEHARIEFEGPVDIRGLNLDRIVCLNERSVEIYPVTEFGEKLPPLGTELNRPCVITFMHLVKGPIKDFGAFVQKIQRLAKAMNAEVRSIDSNTGAVSISVEAFN